MYPRGRHMKRDKGGTVPWGMSPNKIRGNTTGSFGGWGQVVTCSLSCDRGKRLFGERRMWGTNKRRNKKTQHTPNKRKNTMSFERTTQTCET